MHDAVRPQVRRLSGTTLLATKPQRFYERLALRTRTRRFKQASGFDYRPSGQHAHAGVPNHTGFSRLSLETRTLQIADYLARRGAPNVDGSARWVALGLFRRISDNTPLPEVLGTEALMPFQN